MAWSKEELEAAIRRYESELTAAGRAPGTISTYIRDARAFLEWLATGGGEIKAKASGVKGNDGRDRQSRAGRRLAHTSAQPAFPELARLHASWAARGRPPQGPIDWPRDRWVAMLPEDESLFQRLPDNLRREDVRVVAVEAAAGASEARRAFLAMMAWGYGTVGYGPHRTRRILESTADSAMRLWRVARILADQGAVEAYAHLGGDCRLKFLGPSFGTKFLAFSQPASDRPVALIHDNLVSAWLERHGRPDLASLDWHTPTYTAYLDQMQVWADELAITPEEVEYLIFQSMADEGGGQWALR